MIFGKGLPKQAQRHPTLGKRWDNVTAIWNNTYREDAGIEKAVRLLLALSQFLFPGSYIKQLFWRKGTLVQDFAIELFVLAETSFRLLAVYYGWTHGPWVVPLGI